MSYLVGLKNLVAFVWSPSPVVVASYILLHANMKKLTYTAYMVRFCQGWVKRLSPTCMRIILCHSTIKSTYIAISVVLATSKLAKSRSRHCVSWKHFRFRKRQKLSLIFCLVIGFQVFTRESFLSLFLSFSSSSDLAWFMRECLTGVGLLCMDTLSCIHGVGRWQ